MVILRILALSVVLSIWESTIAVAGGSIGAGIVGYDGGSSESSESFFLKRHKIGIEYALDNKEFNKQLEDLAIKISLAQSGVPSNATEILLSLKAQIELIEYADENGIDFPFVVAAVAELLEIFVAAMGYDIPVSALKIATAFLTPYSWGFLFGEAPDPNPNYWLVPVGSGGDRGGSSGGDRGGSSGGGSGGSSGGGGANPGGGDGPSPGH